VPEISRVDIRTPKARRKRRGSIQGSRRGWLLSSSADGGVSSEASESSAPARWLGETLWRTSMTGSSSFSQASRWWGLGGPAPERAARGAGQLVNWFSRSCGTGSAKYGCALIARWARVWRPPPQRWALRVRELVSAAVIDTLSTLSSGRFVALLDQVPELAARGGFVALGDGDHEPQDWPRFARSMAESAFPGRRA